jgi:lysophospholipase L1-like esterase
MNVARTRSNLLRRLALSLAGAALLVWLPVAHSAPEAQGKSASGEHWVGTWATAVVARPQGPQAGPPPGFGPPAGQAAAANGTPPQSGPASVAGQPVQNGQPQAGRGRGGAPPLNLNNQTLRQIVHTSIGGERIRVVLSNAFGTAPLAVGSAHVALREKDATVTPKTDRLLTFGGSSSTTIPAGAVIVSDPVSLSVPAFADLAIDLYLPGDTSASTSPVTTHGGALQTSYVSATGDHAGVLEMPVMTTTASWFFLARVEVLAPETVGAVVAFGDSITDGTRSTVDTNNRWPDHFAKRLAAQGIKLAVLNQGIAGNRVLSDGAGVSALARFDRDVLVQSGATHVIVLESINDIGLARSNPSPSADELIAAHRQLIERAHARGLKIYGATLTPFEGAAYFSAEGEAKRQAVNQWIRTSNAYDGVIDFDAAVRDPGAPTKLLPQYNPGDNLHMNDAGYQAMANAIDLSLFKAPAPGTRTSRR